MAGPRRPPGEPPPHPPRHPPPRRVLSLPPGRGPVRHAVPAAAAGTGAIATQSYANLAYRPDGLRLLRDGKSAQQTLDALTAADDGRSQRQAGIVDTDGTAATYAGDDCHAWAGGRTGPGYAAQGNILVSDETVTALGDAFEASAGRPLAERLLGALAAAQAGAGWGARGGEGGV